MWFLDVPPERLTPIMEQVEQSPHPRLFATEEDFQRLREKASHDGLHKRMLSRIVHEAEQLLDSPPAIRQMTGRRLLSVSRNEVYRISTLALAWRMTDRPAFHQRCLEELRAIASFTDWNPSHFLDVGEMTLAVATGYDWLYNSLSPEDRDLLATAILEKGLTSSEPDAWWRRAKNNWGQVCRTGMMAGALAIAERAPETCRAMMQESLSAIALPMQAYAPGGNYPEGPNYWTYGTGYNVLGLALLESACKTDFGLSDAPGFRETGFYNDLLFGPSGIPFSYSDCGSLGLAKTGKRGTHGISWWFARHFQNAAYIERSERALFEDWCAARIRIKPTHQNSWFTAYSFFWIFEPGEIPATAQSIPLLWSPQGPIPIAIARSSWDDPMATYIGLKGGSPSGPHGHMDGGSFVLDAFGERWISDLGAEEYNRLEQMGIGLWNGKQDGDRWKLFRLNNFSHNTLTLNNTLQLAQGSAEILSATHEPSGHMEIVADLTTLYPSLCTRALRTLALESDGSVLVTDHLEGLPEGTLVSWRACTLQEVASEAPDRVVLSGLNAQLEITQETAHGTWAVHDVTQPQPIYEGDSPNSGVHQLRLETTAPANGTLELRVRLRPLKK